MQNDTFQSQIHNDTQTIKQQNLYVVDCIQQQTKSYSNKEQYFILFFWIRLKKEQY